MGASDSGPARHLRPLEGELLEESAWRAPNFEKPTCIPPLRHATHDGSAEGEIRSTADRRLRREQELLGTKEGGDLPQILPHTRHDL